MKNDKIMQYYDYLMQLASSKCDVQADIEDLVSDTLLAAFTYLHNGGEIKHPKTWLTSTLYHKYNNILRNKYRYPTTIYMDEKMLNYSENNEHFLSDEEVAKVRKELNHLSFITREVLIRYYYGNQSVSEIATDLKIPQGTVKSRLSIGRNQMKKGLENMELNEKYLPGKLYLSFGGTKGLKDEPISLVENDLIAQNLLIIAYERPLTISELSKAIDIPAAYIEPIIKKLVDGELMVQTESGKVYTDFFISKPQDKLESFQPQLDFAHKHFDIIWDILSKMILKINQLDFIHSLTENQQLSLQRYAILKALQDFQFYGIGNINMPIFPKRKDGGMWLANAVALDPGYNLKAYNESLAYTIRGGHRTTTAYCIDKTKQIYFYEFDTALYDNPCRYGGVYHLYFKHIISLLWAIENNLSFDSLKIPNEFISYIPTLKQVGLLDELNQKLHVNIPVICKEDYQKLWTLIQASTKEIIDVVGKEFTAFVLSMKTRIPKHLTSVPELYRCNDASQYIVMAIVKEAYDKGLHLKNITKCCPPALLVYEE